MNYRRGWTDIREIGHDGGAFLVCATEPEMNAFGVLSWMIGAGMGTPGGESELMAAYRVQSYRGDVRECSLAFGDAPNSVGECARVYANNLLETYTFEFDV